MSLADFEFNHGIDAYNYAIFKKNLSSSTKELNLERIEALLDYIAGAEPGLLEKMIESSMSESECHRYAVIYSSYIAMKADLEKIKGELNA